MDAGPHGGIDALGAISRHTAAALFRNRLILAGRDFAFVQDHVDCAELAIAAGLRDEARLLYQLAFLRTGFAPGQLRHQSQVARRTGLWGEDGLDAPASSDTPATGFSVDIALAELRQLRGQAGIGDRLADAASDSFGAAAFERLPLPASPPTPSPVPLPTAPRPGGDPTAAACDALFRLLRRSCPPGGEDDDALGASLEQLRHDILAAPVSDPAADIEDPRRLAAQFLFNSLQHFMQANYQLAYAPFGSAALFHAAARLSPAGMGAYLTNIRCIIRNSRDIFAMIREGSAQAPGDAPDVAAIERWSVLLATHMSGSMLLDLVDELGDLGLMRALWGLLGGAIWRSAIRRDYDVVWRIRDAFLDNGDLARGAGAQRVVALWAAGNRVEWTILGEIHATAGDVERAEAAFARALELAPGDPGTLERRDALRADRFGPFAIVRGFATPAGRQRIRFARQPQKAAAA